MWAAQSSPRSSPQRGHDSLRARRADPEMGSSGNRVGTAALRVAECVEAEREQAVREGDPGDFVAVGATGPDPVEELTQVRIARRLLCGLDQHPAQPA